MRRPVISTIRTVRRARGIGGFTLVELLTVLSILAIIATLATPGMREFASGQKVKALALDITADLLLARSEAVKRNASVTLAPRGNFWAAGWTVASGTENISSRNALSTSTVLTGAPSAITFDFNGRVAAPATQVRMTIAAATDSSPSSQRCIELDLSGRARSRVGACS